MVTVTDSEAMVTLQAHKFNSLVPNTGIPGATYDLYVEGQAPPGGVPSAQPTPAPLPEQGDTWYARGTTTGTGLLEFTVPAGFAWCLREVSAPVGYNLDPALHCTAVLDTTSPPGDTTVALPETPATVHLTAHKFNAEAPSTVIPGATYELLAAGGAPPGYTAPPAPGDAVIPQGARVLFGQGTSDADGNLTFGVPAGFSWCLHELKAPADYQPDPAFHCTTTLTTDTPAADMSVALPEQPTVPASLAFTGGPSLWLSAGGFCALALGFGLILIVGRRERDAATHPRKRRTGPRRRRGRRALGVMGVAGLLVTAALAVTPGAAHAAGPTAPTWWQPVQEEAGFANPLFTISCGSPTFCVRIGPLITGSPGYVMTWNGSTWTKPTRPPGSTNTRVGSSISCIGTSWCMLLDTTGDYQVDSETTWSTPEPTGATGTVRGHVFGPQAVSCGTATRCVAVQLDGSVLVWDGSRWSTPVSRSTYRSTLGAGDPWPTVACPVSSTWCAVTFGPEVYVMTGTQWSPGTALPAPVSWLSCPAPAGCVAMLYNGAVYRQAGDGWSEVAKLPSAVGFSVSCPSTTYCVADGIDPTAAVTLFDTSWQTLPTPSTGTLGDMTCAPATYWCIDVDTARSPLGDEPASFVLAPPPAPQAELSPSTSTVTVSAAGETAPVTLTPSLSGFVSDAGPDAWTARYRWTCSAAGTSTACSAATGTFDAPPVDDQGTFSGTQTDDRAPAPTTSWQVTLPPGRYTIVATVTDTTSGEAGSSSPITVTVNAPAVAALPACDIHLTATGRSATVGEPFAGSVDAIVSAGTAPLATAQVTFSAPTDQPSGTFTGARTATAQSDRTGTAMAPALTAGPVPGAWQVTATMAPDGQCTGTPSATLTLTNTPGPQPKPPAPPPPAPGSPSDPGTPATAQSGTSLAFTGGPSPWLPLGGLAAAVSGSVLVVFTRRRAPIHEKRRRQARNLWSGVAMVSGKLLNNRSPGFRQVAVGLLAAALMLTGTSLSPEPAAAQARPQIFTASCPGPACPYSAPTTAEMGFADDVLARINIERAQPQRRYAVGGQEVPLTPLPMNQSLQQTAQAFAEYLASTGSLQDYSGPFPDGYDATGGNASGPGADSAVIDDAFMLSPGHAGAILSAADDFAGIGVGCDSSGAAWVVELFGDADQAAFSAGQERLHAELAVNSVYSQSGGTVTTVQEPVQDGGGTVPAQDAFPEQPIAADGEFATGADWSCAGVTDAPGSAPTSPLPTPVSGLAASPTGDGYSLVDGAGAISVHGDAPFPRRRRSD